MTQYNLETKLRAIQLHESDGMTYKWLVASEERVSEDTGEFL